MSTPDAGAAAPLGIIGGSAFLDVIELSGAHLRRVESLHGDVMIYDLGDVIFLRRHGEHGYRPPHRVPHHAHVTAFHSLGVRRVAALASAGALLPTLRPGDIVIPDDYLSWHPPPTFAADEYLHIVPELDGTVRELLVQCAHTVTTTASTGEFGTDPRAVETAGVYAETRGPRFETRAEIRLLAQHAHVVGMTAASEATLFQERGIGYAMLCIIDNWAHGVGPTPLTLEAFQTQLARNAVLARALLRELIRIWRAQVAPAHDGAGDR